MQPLQYDLRSSAAKDNSITHAAAAPSNLDAATTIRSAETELQNIRTARNGVGNCSSKTGCRRQSRKKTILKHFLKEFLKGKLLAPKLGKFADKSLSQPGCKGKLLAPKLRKFADKSLSQPGCSHSITINNLQLQKTIVLRMQPRHQATLTQPFQCDLQPQLQETHRTTHTGTTIVAKHIEGTKRPQPQPPHTHEVPFIAGCSHFTRKNTRFRAPAFSPQHTARNIHAAIPMRSTTTASRNA